MIKHNPPACIKAKLQKIFITEPERTGIKFYEEVVDNYPANGGGNKVA